MALLYSDNDDKPLDFKGTLVRDEYFVQRFAAVVVVCSFL